MNAKRDAMYRQRADDPQPGLYRHRQTREVIYVSPQGRFYRPGPPAEEIAPMRASAEDVQLLTEPSDALLGAIAAIDWAEIEDAQAALDALNT